MTVTSTDVENHINSSLAELHVGGRTVAQAILTKAYRLFETFVSQSAQINAAKWAPIAADKSAAQETIAALKARIQALEAMMADQTEATSTGATSSNSQSNNQSMATDPIPKAEAKQIAKGAGRKSNQKAHQRQKHRKAAKKEATKDA